MRIFLHIVFAQADTLEHLYDLLALLSRIAQLVDQQPLSHYLTDAHTRVERGKWILEYHLQVAALYA